jgi:hypothetical protein
MEENVSGNWMGKVKPRAGGWQKERVLFIAGYAWSKSPALIGHKLQHLVIHLSRETLAPERRRNHAFDKNQLI